MHPRRLRIYLSDHLALMVGESELADRCWSSNRDTPLGDFLDRLRVDVRGQRSVIADLLRRFDGEPSLAKTGMAWLLEKLGRAKPNDWLLSYSPLSRVVELESLAAAAQERVSMWNNLDAISTSDPRLAGISFVHFRDQAQGQRDELVRRSRYAAAEAFAE